MGKLFTYGINQLLLFHPLIYKLNVSQQSITVTDLQKRTRSNKSCITFSITADDHKDNRVV